MSPRCRSVIVATTNLRNGLAHRHRIKLLSKFIRALHDYEDEISAAVEADLGGNFASGVKGDLECGAVIQETMALYQKVRSEETPDVNMKSCRFIPSSSPFEGLSDCGAIARILIGPWNHPLFLMITPFIYAIAEGRCCMVKPNEESSHCAAIVSRILKDYFYKASNIYRVIFGGSCVSNTILSLNWALNGAQHNQSSMVISRPSITLNIGSKTPIFIDKSTTDLKSCARRVLADKMERSGQVFYAPDYVVVHEDVADSFITHMKKAYASYRESNDSNGNESDIFLRIRHEKHWDRLLHLIEDVKEKGHLGICGNLHEANRNKLFFPLIMVKNPSKNSLAMSEEIFGPILPIIIVRSMQEGVEYVKNLNSSRPTSLYVYSSKKKVIERIVRSVIGVACSGDRHFFLSRDALSASVTHAESDECTTWSEESIPSMCELEDAMKVCPAVTQSGPRSMDEVKFFDLATRFLFGLTMFMLSAGKSPPSFLLGLIFGAGLVNGDSSKVADTSSAKDKQQSSTP